MVQFLCLMSKEDARGLEAFDARREATIAAAMDGSEEGSTAVLRQVLAGEVLSFDEGYDPSDDWRCRYFKLGGEPALTVYGWFSCRVFDDGAGWVVQNVDGSQRSVGRLYNIPREQLLYLGAMYYPYEDPIWFGDDAARNQLALLSRLDDGRIRLEFPASLVELDFDIFE